MVETAGHALAPVLLLALLPAGCTPKAPLNTASSPTAAPDWRPDLGLLDAWTVELQDRLGMVPPFVARYERANRAVRYVAARHTALPGTPTFALVEREFRELRPDVVVIEGIPAALGANPPEIVAVVRATPPQGPWPAGEAFFAASLALREGKLFIGAEPDDREIKDGLAAQGYGEEDVLAFLVLRMVLEWRREARQEPIETLARRFASSWLKDVGSTGSWELDRLGPWYAKRNGRVLDLEAITDREITPDESPGALFTQRMAAAELRLRDGCIVRQIGRMVARHRRVLVVYGSGHFVSERRVLEAMLGPATLVATP